MCSWSMATLSMQNNSDYFAIKKKYFTVEFSFLIPPFNIFIVQVSRFDCHMGYIHILQVVIYTHMANWGPIDLDIHILLWIYVSYEFKF